ncbi:MAG: hypothetical protein A2830_00180 [Candidatus Taylorbacteria bacterium RIFCSPHIGHO2_01_FULL_44_110]|uniref:Type II secretion system protein J n=1 Tax=Candidatus Taylorbacteria bacterium RIFCSPHIGHO2_12_FULL_45_16 TaxID=1802315 RepID=A0A1G2MY97_9BACT|nr:MAG: hypothetical protein A2830_00180 [Candidatus Taylorbacteria bacterium RIFCSPHIGHO2_01_FULL_44_110]OHA28808.1 MAG: hypothetical protein A3F51_02405 [Candidatus Taylorbacteria bacterium RIFCSPHIGHO2_12_FULL_45_16]OHA32867.1 MAG: hypothetical protein A3A23_03205 [Candidatus Taylorbacteria bacterium RIFCSPLOWO2_01_FULL_45_59]OHA38637.1 MAG: hypothetical protein A3I98_01220 [Candidatus Taylorbacteria bacterium RIFCSPLOWO2_02_FULL_45_10b]OHA43916.1 MAG: hypothetical protein A3G04_02015 [Candi
MKNKKVKIHIPIRSSFFMGKSGFTMIEMIVALGIFSVVAVVALGALVRIISANHKAQAIQEAFTNLNFAFESMSRELRVGTSYHCVIDGNFNYNGSSGLTVNKCNLGRNSGIFFESSRTPASGDQCRLVYAYRFYGDPTDGYQLMKAQQNLCADNINLLQNNSNGFLPVISSNVVITDYRLAVMSQEENGTALPYPRILVRLIGYAGVDEKEKTYFDVQTSITQRVKQ